jgi:Tol biopolymer transport system component
MSNKPALLAVLGFLITAVVLGAFSQTGEDLFQKALRLERNEGKMTEAIELYQAILKQFPENRQLAAEAQFRIGQCYERLGNQEAQNAYQTVVRDYGEQKEVVAKAQDRLSKLKRPGVTPDEPEGIRIRQVWKKPYTDFLGDVSSDGRFHAYVYWGNGDLAVRDLASGKDRILTHEAGAATGFAMNPSFSRNGKKIAYSWWNANHTYDLLVVDVDDPSPRRLYRHEGEHVYPGEWLSEDGLIIFRHNYAAGTIQVCLLSISSGAIRVLKTFEKVFPRVTCSPDGAYIAMDYADTEGGKRDISLLAMDGSGEVPLVKHPAADRLFGWVPGRKELLFISDRAGTWDLWAITVDGGRPSGEPKRIYNDIGQVDPVGFTQNGDCYFGFNRRNFYAYVAPFNAETGEVQEKSGRTLSGSIIGAQWSPDGRYLAYIKMNERTPSPLQLTIQDLKTGEERQASENLGMSMSLCWSPDGNSILVTGVAKDKIRTEGRPRGGILTVDIKTGQTTEVLNLSDYKDKFNPPGDDAYPISDVQWSSDGKSIFYLFFTDRLVKRDLATGEEKTLYRHSRFDRGILKRSPDGKNLLFAVRSPEDKKSHLYTMPVEGGNIKELCTAQEGAYLETGMWSPDGKYAYFTEIQDGTSLWRIPAEGGIPQKVWHSKDRAEVFSFHPDGKQLALSIYEREMEIRVIENLIEELDKVFKASK